MRVLIFGDSITQGFWDVDGGWVARVRKYYDKKITQNFGENKYPTVFNLGVSGDLATSVLDRIEKESKARSLEGREISIVLAVGINDSTLTDNVARMDVYEFQEQYEALVDKAKSISKNVLCVGLTAVDEKHTNPVKWGDFQYLNNRINLFEDAIKQVATVKEVEFAAVHDMFLKLQEKGADLLSDGLHPNSKGHELITRIISPAIENLVS